MVKGTIGPRDKEEGEDPQTSPQRPPSQQPRGRYVDYERNGWTELRDSNGRRLGISRLTALEEYDVYEAMGSEAVKIDHNRNMATLAACVRAVDDDFVSFPRTRASLRAVIQQLDGAGINAVADWMLKTLRLEAEQQPNSESGVDMETAKN